MTDFRPTGTIDIEGNPYSATSGGRWIKADTEVEVVSVDGTRILVKAVEVENEDANQSKDHQ